MNCLSIALAAHGMVVGTVFGQLSVQASYRFSVDEGATWQADALMVPMSQSSVLVQMQMTVQENGVTAISDGRLYFAEGMFESYVTTAGVSGDVISDILTHRVISFSVPYLQPGPYAQRRVGNVLAIDRMNDTTPLGSGLGVLVQNRQLNASSAPSRVNPLVTMQYRLTMDGTVGERHFSSAFLAFSALPFAVANASEVSVIDARGTTAETRIVAVTQTTGSVIVIPSPGGTAVVLGSVVLALRRRR